MSLIFGNLNLSVPQRCTVGTLLENKTLLAVMQFPRYSSYGRRYSLKELSSNIGNMHYLDAEDKHEQEMVYQTFEPYNTKLLCLSF